MDLPSFLTTVHKKRTAWRQVCIRVIYSALFFSLAFGGSVSVLNAATIPSTAYQAALLSVSAPSKLAPGEITQARLEFKNTGSTPWLKAGKNFVSLYRWDPIRKVELASQFVAPSWETPTRPLRLPVDRVEVGSTLGMNVLLKAPLAPGTYTETFILTAEDAAWMKYGQVTFKIDVVASSVAPALPLTLPTSTPVISSSSPSLPTTSPNRAELSTLPPPASASGWSAELVEKSGSEWQLNPEEVVNITLKFLNKGTAIWTRDSVNFVSLYATDGAKERSSSFKTMIWNGNAAARLKETHVRPGQIGSVTFQIKAPSTAGTYKETFTLAAESIAFISGSSVTLPIRVIPSATLEFVETPLPTPEAAPQTPTTPTVPSGPIRTALLLLRSVQSMTLLGNGRQEIQVGFKNTGETTWNSRSMRFKSLNPPSNERWASLRDESWYNTSEPVRVAGDVKPGEIGFLTFKVKAPAKRGTYKATFTLHADGQPVTGGDIEIPITVTSDGYIEPEPVLPPPPVNPTPQPNAPTPAPLITFPAINPVPLTGDVSTLPNEPRIRVGIFRTTDDQMVVRSMQVPVIVSQNGTTICRLNPAESATVRFDRINKVYILSGGSCTGQSSGLYLFRAEDGIAPLELADFSRPVSGTPGGNDNSFRSQLELRYTPATDGVWVINELPIEWYLKGIAETSNISPPEFQRTLLVTARTYATYHVQRGTKHADEFYTVDAKYDQVYRGYGAERRNPNVVAAIDATRGQIVTYQGKLAITPYFSRSDGRTRGWGEVWYGASNYPWLVSVPVPQDQGKTLWGHGVGMSASGALAMANEGKRYDQILTYFYQGIELRKAYK
ncbi:hypothetical protein KBD61_05235 [Patescibacteria group bacterium]|nr:hypothetical protein [Patescibacteria group bacterium]MBP9710395.1 hypothetical protein [Patescibacteria group bacterium]